MFSFTHSVSFWGYYLRKSSLFALVCLVFLFGACPLHAQQGVGVAGCIYIAVVIRKSNRDIFAVEDITSMNIIWMLLFFLSGSAVGSFLNVVADRLPQGKSIVSPPSHCPGCSRELSAWELVPIFSYLWLKGRCRTCNMAIPLRLFLVELGTGVLFAVLFWRYGLGWELALAVLYCCLFLSLLVIDIEHGILPNAIVYGGMVVAFVLAVVVRVVPWMTEIRIESAIVPDLSSAAVGGAVGFGLLLLPALIYPLLTGKEGMGWGDVKLAGLIGLVVGFPLVLLAMFLAIISGGLVAAILLLLKRKGGKDAIAFGPFLAVAAILTLLWGNGVLGALGFS
ncbi:MAG: prepilin peptidase [Chloroflexi bacterium]|nr:prepilin peptidase [Chloroflexota bacterium]MBM3172523.1 prepilin peptidase [Chloroflexota bacterium]MBM3175217.1 prepilin peptidase [Chloroflexota bacterium]MBM4450330.1 prepilin peptidase [Chloroflexota bacterium]